MSSSMKTLRESSMLDGGNAAYLEALYEDYLNAPDSLAQHWKDYFANLPKVDNSSDISHAQLKEKYLQLAKTPITALSPGSANHKQVAVLQLVQAYRERGHLLADIDPIRFREKPTVPDLTLEYHGLDNNDLAQTFETGLADGPKTATLKEIYSTLQQTYCGNVGAEFMHITDAKEQNWLKKRIEQHEPRFIPAVKKRILNRLTAAEGLEKYLHKKYVGQKRFSLEGSESLIHLIDDIIQRGGENGIKEMVFGMAHRGRLNVLVNIMGKFPSELFAEFEGRQEKNGAGDVKYHQGFSADAKTPGGFVHLALAFNPSHLEIVSPVVQGSVRARQKRRGDNAGKQVLPVIMHGDAAFIGQGVVMETFSMSQTRHFSTGGTVHIVINNQVGFTTSNPSDVRSTRYCTDVAKMVEAPIFHVNGDDPEAVLWVTQIALDYRLKFNKDVVIDLVSYRRHGHNEADEPAATQPMMYKIIRAHKTTRTLYVEKLVAEGIVTSEEAEAMLVDYRQRLEAGEQVTDTQHDNQTNQFPVDWSPFINKHWTERSITKLSTKKLQALAEKLYTLPSNFKPQNQVGNVVKARSKMGQGKQPMDWGFAETLAYATLLQEGYNIRISGQDCGRGTFAHRHAVLYDQNTGDSHIALKAINAKADFTIVDSLLSEEAVLAFEYGYALAEPNNLVIWEAQFGDFANGAQVVIDQFISSGEQKWGRLNGLALFLPHGYEGMGAEHSSARLERFLQLSAEHNMQVCVPSTPAQTFHMIRRQMVRQFRKPLIVMTPKSLLRHKLAINELSDLSEGEFQNVIGEVDDINPLKVKRVVLCSGKVYYELLTKRREEKINDMAIIRIEQLYPFPENDLKAILVPYKNANDVVWCQEEPMNQGAWYCSQHHIRRCLSAKQTLSYAGRDSAAAPAVGYPSKHASEQAALISDALNL